MFSSTEKGRGVKQGHTTHFPKHRGAPAPQGTLALAMPTPAAARASSSGGSAHLPCQAAQQRIAIPRCSARFVDGEVVALDANVLQQPHAELLPRSRERQRGHRWSHKHVRPTFRKEGARAEIVCVCVPCAFAVRSYVQTRFLATEDSSTLTPLVRLFVFKNIHSPHDEPWKVRVGR